MKQILLMLGLVIIFTSCNGGKQSKVDLQIPDKVIVSKSEKHQHFKGTRVFMAVPEGYFPLISLIRFQKNDNTYIQTVESPHTNYLEHKESIIHSLNENSSNGRLKTYYQKEFKLGDYDALLVYGANSFPDEDIMTLLLGDKDFYVMVVGIFPNNDDIAKQEVLSALLSVYYDKSADPDYSSLENFMIDMSNSPF